MSIFQSMNLKPCPRCGVVPSERDIRLTRLNNAPRMDGKPSAIISVEIVHHCKLDIPGVVNGPYTSVRGRDHESAEAGWNAGL